MPRCLAPLSILLALSGLSTAAEPKLFVDSNRDELVAAVPELANLAFDPNQDALDALLSATGGELNLMFAKLTNVSATEQIHEMRFGDGMGESSREQTDRYAIKLLPPGAPEPFDELRLDPATGAVAPDASGGFLVSGHFEKLLRYLLPEYRAESRFRYLGRMQDGSHELRLVAFAQRADSRRLYSNVGVGPGRTARLQGLVWIDAATHRIERLRTDLAEHVDGFPLESLTTGIDIAPVKFAAPTAQLWLPARVTVHARYAAGDLHTVHRYSNYRDEAHGDAAAFTVSVSTAEDPWEMLDRGMALERDKHAPEAIALFREIARLHPQMSAARYHLAAALHESGDAAAAETELRAILRDAPDFIAAHNLLGILLFQRGDAAAAAVELRTRVRLQPKDAGAHFSLGQILEKSDPKAALQEYRTAAELAPDNATIKARLEHLSAAPASPAPPETTGPTIKVEVRQVLVPVVVTDKEGHHVTGLTQADFRVFEDGVEQNISAFSVENSGAAGPLPAPAGPPAAQPETAPAPAAPPAKAPPVRRTYLVCIDSLNSAFADLVNVRQSLEKLFRSEPTGDARYVVVAVGNTSQVVQPPTTDPAVVLQAIEGKNFEKLYLSSRRSSVEEEMRSYLRELADARRACDNGEPICRMLMTSLPARANQIAQEESLNSTSFLEELGRLVGQLAKETGRRTLVLVSDGFQNVPGKPAFEMLDAYFPGLRTALRSFDRITALDSVLRLAANQNIPIYTIDARGLYTQSYYDAANPGSVGRAAPAILGVMNNASRDAGDTLSEIAAATGGTAFKNSNDIFAGLERAFADGRQYYVLAYVSSNARQDGKFRAISVRLKNGKLVVNAKRGYWNGS